MMWGKSQPARKRSNSCARTTNCSVLASVSFLNYLAHEVYLTVFVLYATLRYNWNERDVGNSARGSRYPPR